MGGGGRALIVQGGLGGHLNSWWIPRSAGSSSCERPNPPDLLGAVAQWSDLDISASLDLTCILVKFSFIGVHDHFPITD